MEAHKLMYNSEKEEILLPEYGRGVQELIQFARTLTAPEKQQAAIEQIIQIILILQPQVRNIEDYRGKLWKHVYLIGNYQLTALPKDGEAPQKPEENHLHVSISYPQHNAKFRHYGSQVMKLIQKAMALPEGQVRDGLVFSIGSYMKLAYKTWNKDHYPGDESVREDLLAMSEGMLDFNKLSQDVERQAYAQRSRQQAQPEQPDLMSPSQRRRFYQQQMTVGQPARQRKRRR